jgi:hypothetical protein
MNFRNVRFVFFVNFETIDDLEGYRGESQERCLELKHRRQIAGATVVGQFSKRPFIVRYPVSSGGGGLFAIKEAALFECVQRMRSQGVALRDAQVTAA